MRETVSTVWVNEGQVSAYPVYIGFQLLEKIPGWIKMKSRGSKIALVYDQKLEATAKILEPLLQNQGYTCVLLALKGGESQKSWTTVSKVLDTLVENRFERLDTVLAMGGGVIGDLVGFAASIYLRGIDIVHVATTLVSQVDSAVGGKTGINHSQGKNLIGTFYPPKAVICDINLLSTLPKNEISCGLAEVIKYGIIQDKALFEFIEKNVQELALCEVIQNVDLWIHLVLSSCTNKAYVVTHDEKEAGLREILNFGHTLGHAIEAAFNYEGYLHGEAVALGMRAALRLAVKYPCLTPQLAGHIELVLDQLGFPKTIKPISKQAIIDKLILDKKVKLGQIRFVLPTNLGEVKTVPDVSFESINNVLDELLSTPL